jgi:hypothetical protein
MAGLQALFASFSKSTPVFAKHFQRELWRFYKNSKSYKGSKPKKAISKYFRRAALVLDALSAP